MGVVYLLPPSANGSCCRRSFADQYPEVTKNVSYIYVSVLQLEIAAGMR